MESLVVIGNFDGVHRGHQSVLSAARREADRLGLVSRLLTFDPHPAYTLGRQPPAMLTTIERKRELIERACPGIEVIVREFTLDLAAQTPEEFVECTLHRELGAKLVMVGHNFRFGRGRSGGIDELTRLGATYGFEVMSQPLAGDRRGAWSSTRVRGLVAAGEIEEAAAILGRPHMLSGEVVAGDRRGRTLGFPTCNLRNVPEALPPFGVYAVLVDRVEPGGARALARGVANLGLRPTVDERSAPLLEVHLLDLDGDLYGAALRVHLLHRLRDEQRFSGVDELRRQIGADCERAREMLAACSPEGEAWR